MRVGVAIKPRSRSSVRAIGPSVAEPDRVSGVEILTAVVVDDADRVRVHLADLHLPRATAIWSWGSDGVRQGPLRLDRIDTADGAWSPSVPGPRVTVAAQIPSGAAAGLYSFRIDRVAEILTGDWEPALSGTGPCLEDFACYQHPAAVATAASAVGRMSFIRGGVSSVCTGTLLADSDDSSSIPWLLTAEHCISTASEAASVEVVWDYVHPACSPVAPDPTRLPRSVGATLVAHDATSDFALLRLAAVPGPRSVLGWTTNPPAAGETLYRIHHPFGDVRHISVSTACPTCLACPSLPAAGFLYSDPTFGTTAPGSSGSAVFVDRGSGPQVVGQLNGVCGPDADNPCLAANRRVDGRFSVTFPAIQGSLSPATTLPPAPTPIPFSACKPVCRSACRVEACASFRGSRKQRCIKRCTKNATFMCRAQGRCF